MNCSYYSSTFLEVLAICRFNISFCGIEANYNIYSRTAGKEGLPSCTNQRIIITISKEFVPANVCFQSIISTTAMMQHSDRHKDRYKLFNQETVRLHLQMLLRFQ